MKPPQALTDLKGIGPRCDEMLKSVGIKTAEDLLNTGAIEAYCRIIEETNFKANIALLYSLVGAIENRSWLDVAANDKARLRAEIEGLNEIQKNTKL